MTMNIEQLNEKREALQKGLREARVGLAVSYLEWDVPLEIIEEHTGLTIREIKRIAKREGISGLRMTGRKGEAMDGVRLEMARFEGFDDGREHVALKLMRRGVSLAMVAEDTGLPIAELKNILQYQR